MKRACKRGLSLVLAQLIVFLTIAVVGNIQTNAATFDDINQSSIWIKQSVSGPCVLDACAMMIRRTLIATGNTNWASVTESSLKGTACQSGWSVWNSFDYMGVSVRHNSFNSTASSLKNILDSRPEGIVLYSRSKGHAVLVTDYSGDTFYCADPAYGDKRNLNSANQGVSYSNSTEYWYVSSPKVTLTPPDTTPPDPVTDLHCDKDLYNTSESITFYWSPVSGATEYWVYLWKDGQQLYEYNCGSNTSFTQAPSGEGDYHLRIRPKNVYGYNDNSPSCSFTVTNSVPSPVTDLHCDKGVYNTSESITFYWSPVRGATEYRVYLWKDGQQLYEYNCGSNTSFTQAPSGEGDYHLCIRPKNLNGYNDNSPSCSFIVTNSVPSPVTDLRCDKGVYNTSESITFYWSPVRGATEYRVYLWKDGQQLYEYNCGSNTSFTQAPSGEGDYHLCIRPKNVNGYNDNSPACFFVVSEIIDDVAPTIINPSITNVSDDSFTINCDLNDNIGVTRVWLNVYGPNGSQNGYSVDAANGTFSHTVFTSDYSGSGEYVVHLYAYDLAGNGSMYAYDSILVINDDIAPTISFPSVKDASADCFTISCKLNDNVGVTRVWLNVYGPNGCQKGYSVDAANGTFSHTIFTSDYSGPGEYVVHLYAYDLAGNGSRFAFERINAYDPFLITLDPDGGVCGIPAITAYYNEIYGTLPEPTRDSFAFDGWFLADGTLVTESTICTMTADHTLTAHWTAVETSGTLTAKADSGAMVDRERGFVYGLAFGVTEAALREQYLDIADGTHMEIERVSAAIGTGTVLHLVDDTTGDELESFTVVIFGDVTGDGLLNSSDVTEIRSVNAGIITYEADSAQFFAADVTRDGNVNSSDVTEFRNANAGISDVSQTI